MTPVKIALTAAASAAGTAAVLFLGYYKGKSDGRREASEGPLADAIKELIGYHKGEQTKETENKESRQPSHGRPQQSASS